MTSSRPQLPSPKIGVIILPRTSGRNEVTHLSVCCVPGSVVGAKDTRRRGDPSLKDSAAGIVGGSQHKTGPGRDADTSQRRCGKRESHKQVRSQLREHLPFQRCVWRVLSAQGTLLGALKKHSPHPREKNWHSVTGKINVHT